MKRLIAVLGALVLIIPAFAQDKGKIDARLDAARDVLNQVMATPDKQIPDSILKQATCVGVVPGMLKGAFIFGAEYGQGVVTCRTPRGWSGPVFIRLEGGSWGFQIGGQGTDLVLVAVNDKGFQDLLHSKFKIGADASAAAGPVGRHATASTDILLHAELLSYSRTRGVFAGVDLNGAVVSQNLDDTNPPYGGQARPYADILHGNVPVPSTARSFVSTVARYFRSTR